MTLVLAVDDSEITNSLEIIDSPAVLISGDNIRFTNSGHLKAASPGSAAIVIEGSGVVIVNEADGVIENDVGNTAWDAIVGSDDRDVIINNGRISNQIDLRSGNDEVVHRGASQIHDLRLGDGDDLFRLESDYPWYPFVNGGDGYDTYLIAFDPQRSESAVVRDASSNMERLDLRAFDNVLNLDGFGGYSEILLEAGGTYNFLNSANPDVDIALTGAELRIVRNSVFRNITGSDQSDWVTVWDAPLNQFVPMNPGTILGDVDLGAGDDRFELFWVSNSGVPSAPPPQLGGDVLGGAGEDILTIYTIDDRTIDLSRYNGFERLFATAFDRSEGMRLVNVAGFSELYSSLSRFVLAESNLLDATLILGRLTNNVIEPTAMIGRVMTYDTASTVAALQSVATPDTTYWASLTNSGTVLSDITFNRGNDVYDGRLGSVGGTVYGFAGDDDFRGGPGVDRFNGGSGNDTLDGGAGSDLLEGGAGNDTFWVDAGDTVTEYAGEGTDSVYARESFALTAGSAVELLATADWRLTTRLDLTGNELNNAVIGSDGVNVLRGGGGGDTLRGLDGHDTLDGGDGIDRMFGGAGNDSYYVTAGDQAIELANEGFDSVYAHGSFTLAAGSAVEVLATADWRLTHRLDLTGNELNNAVTGNSGVNVLRGGAGNDTLRGLGGTDILDGGAGVDLLIGGADNDSYYVTNGDQVVENGGEGFDAVYAHETFTLNAGSEVEALATADWRLAHRLDLIGNELNNAITGNSGINLLYGRGGADTLRGLGGNDTLDGGAGVDRLEGGDGNDNYYVTAGDSLVELAGEGHDAVYARESYTLTAGAAVELLGTTAWQSTAALDLTGNELANQLIGNSGANALNGLGGNDTLRGMSGNDTLDGGVGADILFGGDGNDSFAFGSASDSVPGAADWIADFVAGDHIDLSAIDANASGGTADDAFSYIGSAAFSGVAGELRAVQSAPGFWNVEGDVDGDRVADLVIEVTVADGHPLGTADFMF